MSDRIVRIEKVTLRSPRPREIGRNARKGNHGSVIEDPVVRLHTADGAVGVGWSRLDRRGAQRILGSRLGDVFQLPNGALDAGAPIDLPLWDLAAKLDGVPLFRLLGGRGRRSVEMYDSSICIDDVDANAEEAMRIFTEDVHSGQQHGFHNFKIKVGRGARWMPTAAGFERDILVIHAVREAAGVNAKLMLDANNGGTLNSAKDTLALCKDAGIYWFEEPFAEDPELNADLNAYLQREGFATLVADGESAPPEAFFDMVKAGHINVVQHDFRARGLSWWRQTAQRIEPWGACCAPHCWGSIVERYAHAHFAASIPNYSLMEAAPAETSGVVLTGWQQAAGTLHVPDSPGTGFDLSPDTIERGVRELDGFRIELA